MLERLNRAESSRMRPDLEAAIEYLPGLASLALWCSFADTDENVIAYTDGKTIFAGADYEKREPKERRFICLHEILHIALCHPSRSVELEKRELHNFNAPLFNIAADAIINGSLEKLTGLQIPPDACTLAKIWQTLEKSIDTKNSSSANKQSANYSFSSSISASTRKIGNLTRAEFGLVNRWSCEDLYYFLKNQFQTGSEGLALITELFGKDGLTGDLRRQGGVNNKPESFHLNNSQIEKLNQEKQEWQQRLRLLRGNVPGLLERLAAELPKVETPWEQILRSILQTAFQEETQMNYSRPSRRWLALERDYPAQAGVNLPFMPDSSKKRGSRLAVALDTSGSIDRELLGRFLAEIAALCTFNQRDLVVIIGDAEVHQIIEIEWRDASEELARIKYTGGVGTDFRPLIKAAARFEPDALVYFTDLYGDTGDEPDFAVIWATHGVAGNAPWGDCISLK